MAADTPIVSIGINKRRRSRRTVKPQETKAPSPTFDVTAQPVASTSIRKTRADRLASIYKKTEDESDYNKKRRERLHKSTAISSNNDVLENNITSIFSKDSKKETDGFPFREELYEGDALLSDEELDIISNLTRYSDKTLNKYPVIQFAYDQDYPLPEIINETQVKYPGLASPDKITALIPEAIYESTYKSLQKLKDTISETYEKDSVEQFVADNMGWSCEDLSKRLTPEQIDSVAMGMVAIDRSSAMLIADVTGFGKGRTMATLLVYGIKVKGKALFLSEKVNLFSDIWRDIIDIGCDEFIGRPFIVNDNASVIDLKTRENIFPKWKPREHKAFLKTGTLPEGCKLILTTYSQFGIKDTNKREFVKKISVDAHIATDEVQNISRQEANATQFMLEVMERAGSVIDASASSGQDIDNLRSYGRIFPWLIAGDYASLDKERQIWASSESVVSAVKEGRILRRETDISGMELEMDTRSSHHDYMIEMQNAFSDVMVAFGRIDGLVGSWCEAENQRIKDSVRQWDYDYNNDLGVDGKRPVEQTYYPFSFGGRLNILCTHFITCLMASMTVDMVEDSILKGHRPVVVLDSTMENIMKDLLSEDSKSDLETLPDADDVEINEDEDDSEIEADVVSEDAVETIEEPPTFKDMLLAVLKKVPFVSMRTKGKRKAEKVDITNYVKKYDQYHDACVDAIEAFPVLDISPLDIIREELEHRGREAFKRHEIIKPWVVGEISGRKMRIVNGQYEMIPKSELDRNSLMSRFNYNDIQSAEDDGNNITVMLMTRSGSTGASMHDAPQFPGPYKRHMFDVLPPNSTKQRLQMYGRTERRGSRTKCLYTTLSTPLPWHYFTLISQNKKMEALAASVSGSKSGSIGHKDLPDFLNRVGDEAAHIFLIRNRDLMERLRIKELDDDEEARRKLYYISTLFRRLAMLSYEDQKTVIKDYMETFARKSVTDALSLKSRLNGSWYIGKTWQFEQGSVNGKTHVDCDDVVLARVHRRVDLPALSYYEIDDYISERMLKWRQKPSGEFEFWRKYIKTPNIINDYLKRFLPLETDIKRLEEFKADKRTTVHGRFLTVDKAAQIMSHIMPGKPFFGLSEENDCELGIIVDVVFPEDIEDAFEFFQYKIKYALPGDYCVRTATLEDLLTDSSKFRIYDRPKHGDGGLDYMYQKFKLASDNSIPSCITYHMLLGNMNKAILDSERLGHGRYVQFRTVDKRLHSGVIISESELIALGKIPVRMQTAEMALTYLLKAKDASLATYSRFLGTKKDSFNKTSYVTLTFHEGKYIVDLPENDIYFTRMAKKEWFCNLFGVSSKALIQERKAMDKDANHMAFELSRDELEHFMKTMYKNGEVMFASGRKRVSINKIISGS